MDAYWKHISDKIEADKLREGQSLFGPKGDTPKKRSRRTLVKEYRNEWVCPRCTTEVKADSNKCRYCGFIVPDKCEKCGQMTVGSVDYPVGSNTTFPLRRLTQTELFRPEWRMWLPEAQPILDGLWEYVGKYLCQKCHPAGLRMFVDLKPEPEDFERMAKMADGEAERARFTFLAKDADRTERAYKYLAEEMKAVVKAAKEDPVVVKMMDDVRAAKDANDVARSQDLQRQVDETLTSAVYKALRHLDSPHRMVYEADSFEIRVRRAIKGAIAAKIRTWYKKPPVRGQGIVQLIEDVEEKIVELAGDVLMAAAALTDAEAERSSPEAKWAISTMERLNGEIETLKGLIETEQDDSVRAVMNEDMTRLQGKYFDVVQQVERLPELLPLEQKLERLSENLTLKYEPLLEVLENIYPKHGPNGYGRNIETPVPVDQAMDTMRRLKLEADRLHGLLEVEENEARKSEIKTELELIASTEYYVWSSMAPKKRDVPERKPIELHPYNAALIASEKTSVVPDLYNPSTWPNAPYDAKRCEACDAPMKSGTLVGVPAVKVLDPEHGGLWFEFKSKAELAKYSKDELANVSKTAFLLCQKCAGAPDLMTHLETMRRRRTVLQKRMERDRRRKAEVIARSEKAVRDAHKSWHDDIYKGLDEALSIVRHYNPVYATGIGWVNDETIRFEQIIIAVVKKGEHKLPEALRVSTGHVVRVLSVDPIFFQSAYLYHWLAPKRRRAWKDAAKLRGWTFTKEGISKADTGDVLATELDHMVELISPGLLESRAEELRVALSQAKAAYRSDSWDLIHLKSGKTQRRTVYDLRSGERKYKSDRAIQMGIEYKATELCFAKDWVRRVNKAYVKAARYADAVSLGTYELPIDFWEGFWLLGGSEKRIPVEFLADTRFKGGKLHEPSKLALQFLSDDWNAAPPPKPTVPVAPMPAPIPERPEVEIPAARRMKAVQPRDFGHKAPTPIVPEDQKPRCLAHPHPDSIAVATGRVSIKRPSVDECKRIHQGLLDRMVTYRRYLEAKAEGRVMQSSILGPSSVEKDFESIRKSIEEGSKVYPDVKVPVLPPPPKPKVLRLRKK